MIGADATRETKFAPEAKNSLLYIPYEFIEYIFIDANNYDIFGSTLYKNETMNIQFEIPMYWLGKYFADETSEDDGYIVLKHTAIANKYDGSGAICSVYREPDETVDETMNMLGNQTIVWQNQEYAYIVGRPTDVQYPIWDGSDKEDSIFADEYEKMSNGITHIESTFSLINDVDVPVITNAENMSYAQIRDLQRQVNNGNFPWRLDYEQVVQSFLSGKGIDVEGGKITELAGGGSAGGISLTYTVGEKEYLIELFKPIDKTDSGIWVVRTYEENNANSIKEISFYDTTPTENWIEKQEDGWYKFPLSINEVFPWFEYENEPYPKAITAYYTEEGHSLIQELAKINAPYEYRTMSKVLSMQISFSEKAVSGGLWFVFDYEDGSSEASETFNVLME